MSQRSMTRENVQQQCVASLSLLSMCSEPLPPLYDSITYVTLENVQRECAVSLTFSRTHSREHILASHVCHRDL